MGKCHMMLTQCTLEDIKLYNEEIERQQEAQNPFYLEDSQEEYMRRWYAAGMNFEQQLEEIEWSHPNSIDHRVPTGDNALDDWDSELDDCLIPEEYDDHITDVENSIDGTEEINLSDLYP